MAAFIVISLNEHLNWIVDGIKNCRPHNPDVTTYISTGKILGKKEDGLYTYEYTTYSKHDNDNGDTTLHSRRESDIPRNLFSNQIAQFLKFSGNTGAQLNIFCLDNPMSQEDMDVSSWMIEEIKAVYESRKVDNFQLVRVLFSYQVDNPANVTRQIDITNLQQLLSTCTENTDGFLYRILYIDNQNIHGAALCLGKDGHDTMMPRMLCDLMMLLSNTNSTITANAISSPTNVFAVGYSECMYYHDDVFRYFNLANRKLLQEHIVKTKNDDTSLDLEHHPIGLEDRQKRLASKYEAVPYKEDINNYPQSIDKWIDDLVVSLKEYIIAYKEEQCELSKAKESESELKQESNAEQITKICPAYIDRTTIYTEYKIDEKDDKALMNNIGNYKNLVDFIQQSEFKRYIKERSENQKQESTSTNKEVDTANPEYRLGCNFIARLFHRKHKLTEQIFPPQSVHKSVPNWEDLNLIAQYEDERKKYDSMKSHVEKIESEIRTIDEKLEKFTLTTHSSSVDNLIDLDRLREYYTSKHVYFIDKIIQIWGKKNPQEQNDEALFDILDEQTKWDLFDLYYVKWDNPFPFIKNIDLQKVCTNLHKGSSPFVNIYRLAPNAQNLTSYYFYTDNPQWNDDIKNGKVSLMNSNNAICIPTEHICSKICMFQFLQMDQETIEGMVDLH